MSGTEPVVCNDDNPEWTNADFARGRPPGDALPPEILACFRKTRGPQRAAVKVPVSIRLSADVVDHFKATGPGWQTRIDDILKAAMRAAG